MFPLSFVKEISQCEFLSREAVYVVHWEDHLVTSYRLDWISKELEKGRVNRNKREETTKMTQLSINYVLGPLTLYIHWLSKYS